MILTYNYENTVKPPRASYHK